MESKLIHRSLSIILSTIDVIHESGINGVSTREIAKRVGISEPAIFRHFKTKTDLLSAVLDYFGHYDSDIFQTTSAKNLEPLEAISYCIELYATYYENYPAITAIAQVLDVMRYDPKLKDQVEGILFGRTLFFNQMIEKAQERGELSKILSSEQLAFLIMGTNRELCLNWRIQNYCFSLREQMIATARGILEAFKTPAKQDPF
jgi:AcrR family transcriptional regulator